MQVRFHATLRQVVGSRLVESEYFEGQTVRQLLDALIERFPALRAQLFDAEGALYRHVHVFVNGRDAPYLSGGLDAPLRASDALDIFPPVGGG